jgi:membrane protein involved in colicin uptake
MKKWMYIIFPGAMLAGFLVIYFSHKEKAEAKERAHIEQVAKEKADADAKKKVAEAKARDDAKKRQEERDAEEKKKVEEKMARQAADDKKVQDAIAEYTAKGNAAAKLLAEQEIKLDKLRKEKDQASREAFETAKQVELARVARRNAELEIQRLTEMISRRASESSMTRPPIVPPAPAAAAPKAAGKS